MKRPRLLWIHAGDVCANLAPRAIRAEYFDVEFCLELQSAQAWTRRFAPNVVCFDFEHPEAAPLRAMRDFKLSNPSLPLLMLTAQHSESLAVWAFRARIWNYLVKPVPKSELRANFNALSRLVGEARRVSRSLQAVRALMPAEDIAGSQAPQARSLQAVLAQVEQYYAQKLRQTAVAAGCGMSSSAFSRAFKAEYGLTFSQYQMSYRIGRACLLLRQGSHSATSAGLAVGFEDASHFARAFRNLLGTSPSLYQRREHPLKPVTERRRHERALPGKSVLRKALRNLPLQRAGTRIDQAVESGLPNQHDRHVGQE